MAYSPRLWLMAIGWWNKINQCRKLKLNLTQSCGKKGMLSYCHFTERGHFSAAQACSWFPFKGTGAFCCKATWMVHFAAKPLLHGWRALLHFAAKPLLHGWRALLQPWQHLLAMQLWVCVLALKQLLKRGQGRGRVCVCVGGASRFSAWAGVGCLCRGYGLGRCMCVWGTADSATFGLPRQGLLRL